ncbi:hypothetical protein N7497_001442 [Penicillium chrysogenum]|nr:hypothetical protein N7497_001442 [Penicillium chrysogenum]
MTEPNICSPQHDDGCLEGLPLSIRRRERETDYMLFHIDPVDLTHDFLDEATAYFPRLRLSFDIPHKLLLITIPSPEHAAAIGALSEETRRDLDSMGHGLSHAIKSYPGGGTRAQNGKGKDADIAFGPRRRAVGERANGNERYTVVAEIAISETETKLKRDTDFWLDPLCGNANLVITITASRKLAYIKIDTWQRVNDQAHWTMAAESERPPHLNGTPGRSSGPKGAEAPSDPTHRSASESGMMERSLVTPQTQPMSQVPKLFPTPPSASASASTTNSAVSSREPSPVRHSSRTYTPTYNPSSPTRVSSQSRKTSQDRSSPIRHSNGLTSGPPTSSPTPNLQRSSSSPVRSLGLSVPVDSPANVPGPGKVQYAIMGREPSHGSGFDTPEYFAEKIFIAVLAARVLLETVEEMASNPSTPSSETPTKPVIPEESRLHRIDEDPTPRAPHQTLGSGSDSGENRSSEPKEETRPQAPSAAKTTKTLMSQRSTTSLSASARGKPADGSVRNMIVETETVSSIPQVSMGVGNGERGNASRAEQGTLRMKPSNETIRPRKEKKKNRRPNALLTTGPVTSKADIFEARVANAVDEADVSDSDETFVYDSNPPDPYPSRPPRYHSRTPSATSMASQAEQLAGRTRGLRDTSHGVTGKRSMKFTNTNPYNNGSIEGDGVEIDMASRSTRPDGSGTITPRHHNLGRLHGRNGMHPNLFDNDSAHSQSQSQKSPRHFIGNSYRHSRHRLSPNYRTIGGSKKSGEYDYEAEGADDERTPLVGTPRTMHSRGGRRPNSASLRQMQYMAQRERGVFARFGSCAIIFLLLLIVAGGATSFIVAATQPLLDVQVIAIQNVLASEQEIMLDLNVQAINPNLFL